MSITMQQVMAYLNADEPRYAEAASLGAEAIPHLVVLIEGTDIALASKAAYLAGLIPSLSSADAVRRALAHRDPVVRVAGAAALAYLPPIEATPLLIQSLDDEDEGIRRLVLDALPYKPSDVLYEAIEHLVRSNKHPDLRMRAAEILTRWRERQGARNKSNSANEHLGNTNT